MALFEFDATGYVPEKIQGFDPIPAGTYIAEIVDSDVSPLKSGNGTGMNLQFRIIDGEFANRRIFARLNVQHSNQIAEQIGQKLLKQTLAATKVMRMRDTSDLHNIPVRIGVKVRKNENTDYPPSNEVTGVEAVEGQSAQDAVAGMKKSAAAKSASTAPWAK